MTDVTGLFKKLIAIRSPSGEEGKIAEYLISFFSRFKCEIISDKTKGKTGLGADNLIVRFPSLKNKNDFVGFASHMDTVACDLPVEYVETKNMIKSAGKTILGADDKAGIAAAAAAAIDMRRALKTENIPGIELIFTAGEEKGLVGAKALRKNLIRSKIVYVLDSEGAVGKASIAAPTHIKYSVKIKGKAAHAGINPEKGINAVLKAAEILKKLPSGKISNDTVANVGIIKGGAATNIVPDLCVIEGEFRSHRESRLEKLKEKTIAAARGAGVSLTMKKEYGSFKIKNTDRSVKLFKKALFLMKKKPVLTVSNGGSDASVFNALSKSCLNISVGMENVHSNKEFIRKINLIHAVKLFKNIVKCYYEV